jgi:hypothetical protein
MFFNLFETGYYLWTISMFMLIVALIGTMLLVWLPSVIYYGIWGIPHVAYAFVVGIFFYHGTIRDPRVSPVPVRDSHLSTNSIRFWAVYSQTSNLLLLNIFPFFMDNIPEYIRGFKTIFTVVSILTSHWLLMNLIYREIGEDFSKKMLLMFISYTVTAIAYVTLVLVNAKRDQLDFCLVLLWMFSFTQWLIISALIAGIYRDCLVLVRVPHEDGGGCVQIHPQLESVNNAVIEIPIAEASFTIYGNLERNPDYACEAAP